VKYLITLALNNVYLIAEECHVNFMMEIHTRLSQKHVDS